VADKFDIIDKPNERSSHTHITLRGGGVVFYFGIFLFTILQGWLYPAFFLGLSLISTVSFLDDIRPLSSRLRLSLHFMAMGIMFIDLGLYALPWYFWVIALVIAVGIINAFNFMDGINGITGLYALANLTTFMVINQWIVSFTDFNLLII
jgi:UDP-N-acetylmuramyl pentapeptide phosphotransferase/UDP-N-acetylglucosamine-1-phosphate transferase